MDSLHPNINIDDVSPPPCGLSGLEADVKIQRVPSSSRRSDGNRPGAHLLTAGLILFTLSVCQVDIRAVSAAWL